MVGNFRDENLTFQYALLLPTSHTEEITLLRLTTRLAFPGWDQRPELEAWGMQVMCVCVRMHVCMMCEGEEWGS